MMKICHSTAYHPESPVAYNGDHCPACRLGLALSELRLSDVDAELDMAKAAKMLHHSQLIVERLERMLADQTPYNPPYLPGVT